MAATQVSVYRPPAAWSTTLAQLVIIIPAYEVLTIDRMELIGGETSAASLLRAGLYEVGGTSASGGSPSSAEVTVHDLLADSVPAGWGFEWGHTTEPTLGTKRAELAVQPFGGVDAWPPEGKPFTRHNKSASATQMVIRSVSGTSLAGLRLALILGA